jgi:phage tail sheath protein FI
MAVVSPRRASVVNVTSESSQLTNVLADYATASSSSYAVFDSGWVYGYDRYNDKYCWTPACGHTAGLMVRSDLLRDAWFSPAGFSRGQYLGITKLAFNPSKSSRDDLYRNRINPVVTFAGQGTVLFGDKTALTVPSAFDRINVRRLFIVLEKAIATAAKAQLFEFNDAFTRAQFRAAVEPFLRDVKNRRGLVDFSVVCDETNNTDTVIDRNEFVCSIFVKPAKSINFITLNFVAARSGVEFSEIYGAV